MRIFIVVIVTVFFGVSFVEAAPPIPEKKQDLGVLEKDLAVQKKQRAELEKEAQEIEKEVKGFRKKMVRSAKEIQENENVLHELEDQIAALEDEKAVIQTTLSNDKRSFSRLILALQRLERVPPQALIARPEAPLQTAQSAMLMREIIGNLRAQAERLEISLSRLDEVSQSLEVKRSETEYASEKLRKDRAVLAGLAAKKEALFKKANKDLQAQQARIEQISLQAKSLSDLVRRLEEEKAEERSRGMRRKARVVPVPRAGKPQLPIPGVIAVAYGEPDNFGAPSEGLSIEGRRGALVVAPMGGVVRFAGYFKNYGNMVILEHENNYHSLVAGFEKIDTLVGQQVSVGEPLGTLHKASSGKAPKLYYELRHKGKAVNPSKKFPIG